MTPYKIVGKVLGEMFENPVYKTEGTELSEIIDLQAYMYSEGNYGCDCNRKIFSGLYQYDEELGCGDDYAYEKLYLVTPQGLFINLLEHERFKGD